MKIRLFFFAAGAALLSIIPKIAVGTVMPAAEMRARFAVAELPLTYDFDGKKFFCETATTFNALTISRTLFFDFAILPENHRVLQSWNRDLPDWVPFWFSEYERSPLRTPLPLETNDFTLDPACAAGGLMRCIRRGGGKLPVYTFLRRGSLGELLVEWTTPERADLPDAIAGDRDLSKQSALMYSYCEDRK